MSASSPERRVNFSAGTNARMVPARPHIEQLQVIVLSSDMVTSYATAPQWQLPWWSCSGIGEGLKGYYTIHSKIECDRKQQTHLRREWVMGVSAGPAVTMNLIMEIPPRYFFGRVDPAFVYGRESRTKKRCQIKK